jgi:hypothetical protein
VYSPGSGASLWCTAAFDALYQATDQRLDQAKAKDGHNIMMA